MTLCHLARGVLVSSMCEGLGSGIDVGATRSALVISEEFRTGWGG